MKVCAVIVTYNRKELLQRCLQAVMDQSIAVDFILVVDNCSHDGTSKLFYEGGLYDKSPVVKLIQLGENVGGAGGFYFGIKFAMQMNFDFVWLMDDDGYPDRQCLEELLKQSSSEDICGPLVLSDHEDGLLSFTINDRKSGSYISSVSEFMERYPVTAWDIILPFNGTLINTKIIEKIGLPRKEYFLWGDEVEYMLRAKFNGYTVCTISSARFFHPRAKLTACPMFFGKLFFNDSEQKLKVYCLIRNSVRTYLDYYGYGYAILFLIKALWFYSFSRPSLDKMKMVFVAFWDAVTRNFSRHEMYF